MGGEDVGELLRTSEVGDTVRIRLQKDQLNAVARDRVSPILEPPAVPNGRATFRGFTKDAGGLWDVESITGAPGRAGVG